MRHLTVYRRFFTQSDCYKASATSSFVGVQVHSTGANNPYLRRYVQPDDGREEFVERIGADKLTSREVDAQVKAARSSARNTAQWTALA